MIFLENASGKGFLPINHQYGMTVRRKENEWESSSRCAEGYWFIIPSSVATRHLLPSGEGS